MRALHLSWLKRSDGELGGVEKFAYYLKRGLEETGHECRVVSWSDYPQKEACERIPNPDKARLLGAWAESAFQFDIAVSDGYWGAGISHHPVVPVVHGTWMQFWQNMGNPTPWLHPEVRAQHEAFNAINAYPIAVSLASGRELFKHHRREPYAVINNAVDLAEFMPLKEGRLGAPPIVLHAATNEKKGSQIIPHIARELGAEFQVIYLAAEAGQEARAFQRGDIFLHPSRHEGGAFSLIEAAATGLPIVTSNVGQFEDVGDKHIGRVLSPNATVRQWAEAVREVWGDGITPYRHYARAARNWARREGDFEHWKVRWADALTAIVKG